MPLLPDHAGKASPFRPQEKSSKSLHFPVKFLHAKKLFHNIAPIISYNLLNLNLNTMGKNAKLIRRFDILIVVILISTFFIILTYCLTGCSKNLQSITEKTTVIKEKEPKEGTPPDKETKITINNNVQQKAQPRTTPPSPKPSITQKQTTTQQPQITVITEINNTGREMSVTNANPPIEEPNSCPTDKTACYTILAAFSPILHCTAMDYSMDRTYK